MAAPWTDQVLLHNLGLQPGERVLVLVDEPLRPAGEALCAAAGRLGAAGTALHVLPGPARLSVVPASLLRQVAAAEVIVSFLAAVDLQHESAVVRAARSAFREAGHGRWAFGAGLPSEEMLARHLAVDWAAVARLTERAARFLTDTDTVRIVTPAGTDLSFRLDGRPVFQDAGVLRLPGAFGNLPAGEAYLAPLEASAEGRLVIDLCLGDIPLDGPVTLEFRQGRARPVAGGEALRMLQQRLGTDPAAWTLGEFGIGTNPFCRPRGLVTVDEKALGTVHVALGGNLAFGGTNAAPTHYDGVLAGPEIYLDGVRQDLPSA